MRISTTVDGPEQQQTPALPCTAGTFPSHPRVAPEPTPQGGWESLPTHPHTHKQFLCTWTAEQLPQRNPRPVVVNLRILAQLRKSTEKPRCWRDMLLLLLFFKWEEWQPSSEFPWLSEWGICEHFWQFLIPVHKLSYLNEAIQGILNNNNSCYNNKCQLCAC